KCRGATYGCWIAFVNGYFKKATRIEYYQAFAFIVPFFLWYVKINNIAVFSVDDLKFITSRRNLKLPPLLYSFKKGLFNIGYHIAIIVNINNAAYNLRTVVIYIGY